MSLNIVLVEPEIPQNTGNIARTCAATGAELHLVKPLGFSLDDRYMRRAGLDYWFLMKYHVYDDLADFFRKNPGARCWFASTKAPRSHTAADYRDGDFLVFGKEPLRPHSHAGGGPEPEPLQLRGGGALRGPAADGLPGADGSGCADGKGRDGRRLGRLSGVSE